MAGTLQSMMAIARHMARQGSGVVLTITRTPLYQRPLFALPTDCFGSRSDYLRLVSFDTPTPQLKHQKTDHEDIASEHYGADD